MNKYIKYAAIGVVCYLIGFYEMKYKAVKCIANAYIDKNEELKKKTEDSA